MNANYTKIENPVFQHLCNQIIKKECVPFLGSGISNPCKYKGASSAFSDRKGHTVEGLIKAVSDKPNQNLDELCERFLWQNNSKSNNEAMGQLLEKLEIKEFVNLLPTQAHHCIALLVREGLLSQIITTNYDCALERAFLQSYGHECVGKRTKERDGFCSEYISIVHDQRSCVHQRPGLRGSGECLHLYKINGCACSLNIEDKDYYLRILLTMTQLQSWRDRRWAKDTFRVALRSSTVLFSGFGSEEPQVIHTVHQILDEYSSFLNGKDEDLNIKSLPPNTPIVHCYKANPDLCHLQITNNYVQSVGGKYNQELANELILTMSSLNETSSIKELHADDLWLFIYQEVQNLQVRKILANATCGQLAISAFLMSKYLFKRINSEWDAKDSQMREYFLSKTGVEHFPTNLTKLLAYLIYDGKKYAPLKQYPNLVCELLLICYALKPDLNSSTFYRDTIGTQWFKAANLQGNDQLYLTGKRPIRSAINSAATGDIVGSTTAFTLTTGYSSSRTHQNVVRITCNANGTRSYQTLSVFTFPEVMILAEQYLKNGDWNEYESFFVNLVRFPSKWRSRLNVSKKEKYFREE